jgi:hypothetical protein
VPAEETSGYTGGAIAEMFPAYAPPEERTTGYGAVGFVT